MKKIDFKAEFEKQRSMGVDIANPMNNLITKRKPEIEKVKVVINSDPPKKSRRVQLLMTQELYNRVKEASFKNSISINEFICQVLNQVV